MPGLGYTLGALEIGGILSTLFFGIATMQAYNYYKDYPKDLWYLKAMAITIWFFEFIHTILLWHAIFSLTITFFGQPEHIIAPPQTLYFTLLLSAIIATMVQLFFANRIRLFSGRVLVPVVASIMSCLYLLGMIAAVTITCVHNTLAVLQTYRWLASLLFSLATVIDAVIAAAMCYCLGRVRNSDYPKTRNIIDTLILWCIESTVAKTGASIIQLCLFLTRGESDFLWLIFILPRASLFSNSMFAALNGRNRVKSATDSDHASGPTFITFNSTGVPSSPQASSPRTRNVVIQMTRITETRIDDGLEDSPTESKTDVECH
ncbi:hypothetical protein MVEN_00790900 [Mycena venus]|uniref:DUF6534 domain-containing protein n=1 Tax=Mycena venus TaxID=2733690 RepID=A0A8H7D3Y9_9AGAR|nr:hypothetical protein MVEN_00790900 [Mycena venus]